MPKDPRKNDGHTNKQRMLLNKRLRDIRSGKYQISQSEENKLVS